MDGMFLVGTDLRAVRTCGRNWPRKGARGTKTVRTEIKTGLQDGRDVFIVGGVGGVAPDSNLVYPADPHSAVP